MADFSLILWSDHPEEADGLAIASLRAPWQFGPHNVEAITVPPEALCRNMGQAYTGALAMASYPIKIYAHQDIVMEDRDYLTKLAAMFEADPRIGVIGIVGSTIDTGGAFFHAPTPLKIGEVLEPWNDYGAPGTFFRTMYQLESTWASRFDPQRAEVKVVDCLLFASVLATAFATCYLKTHLVAEDYCMRARAQGRTVWIIDALTKHFSTGTVDVTYWESMRVFRRKWRHMLPKGLPSTEQYRRAFEQAAKGVGRGWDDLWDESRIRHQLQEVA